MNTEIETEIEKIKEKVRPILLKYGATHAGLFGSVVRGDMTQDSDVDIYVEFPKDKHLGLKFITIILELEKALTGAGIRPMSIVCINCLTRSFPM